MKKYKSAGFVGLIVLMSPISVYSAFDPLDINQNGITDSSEPLVIVDHDISLPAGEYFFNDLNITTGSTLYLESDPNSTNNYKGVKINAANITIDSGSNISANGKGYGYESGPGAPPIDISGLNTAGASYGGEGWASVSTSTYGSAIFPKDLGSGGHFYYGKGGGAIWLVVNGNLNNNGTISANGTETSSGGSILIETIDLSGSGSIVANGGSSYCPNTCYGPGGGGRIAVYYNNTYFTGNSYALGKNVYGGTSKPGTVGFFDRTNNNLDVVSTWKFEKNDSPFSFNDINVRDNAIAYTDVNAQINASNLNVQNFSNLYVSNNQNFNVKNISINNNSQLYIDGFGTINLKTLDINNYGVVNVAPERILEITGDNLTIDSTSKLHADGAGYPANTGPGAPPLGSSFGASYGGIGHGMVATSTYGDEFYPTDFGSGGGGYFPAGGGAINLQFKNITNNGIISSNGRNTSSGGSVYVVAGSLSGSGEFVARGGESYCPNTCYGPGGGGRVAVYYTTNNFSGALSAPGRNMYGGSSTDGTVIFKENKACTINCFSNVMFLPGLMGSRLYEEQNGVEKELWYSTDDSDHARLVLDNSGKSINQIYTKNDTQNNGENHETGLVDEATLGLNIYKTFISNLRDWKTQGLYNDYAMIPYDWRLSLDDIISNGATTTDGKLYYTNSQSFDKSFILNKLRDLQKTSKSGKVTIVAHSNGGLVAKALIQKLKDINDPLYYQIDKVILVAVPQIGTPEAVMELLHGANMGPLGFVMHDERSRDLAKNMPTAYNLLPSDSYFTVVDPSYSIDKIASFEDKPLLNSFFSQYGFYISNPNELEDFVLGKEGRSVPAFTDTTNPNIGNTSLYADAKSLHARIDYWQPASTTKVIQVAGWGEETLAGFDYKIKNGKLTINPRKVIDGDQTVVIPSALWMSTSTPHVGRWWVDLANYDSLVKTERTHKDILEVGNLINFIKKSIINTSFIKDGIITDDPVDLSVTGTRLHYILHSPLNIQVIDSSGKVTGFDSLNKVLIEEIPGVSYEEYGDIKFLSVPADIDHTVKLYGYADGQFSLDIEKQQGNQVVEEASFDGFPSSTTTVAEIDVVANSPVASSTLKLDFNNDKIFDVSVQAKNGEAVTMPNPLDVIAENKKVILGGPMPDFTTTISGFVNGDTLTNSTYGSSICASDATSTLMTGNFVINCSLGTLSSDTYYFRSFVSGVLNVAYKFSGIKFEEKQEGYKNPIFEVGTTIQLKFNLKNYYSKKVSAKELPILEISKPGPRIYSDSNSVYQVSTSTHFKQNEEGEYSYQWKTKGLLPGYWYKIWIKLDDGNVYSLIIGIK